ncbi:MAG: DUF4358 domain-containing protein [Clostridia bacterium]|nr:DUF4358 domain-containing protein [Clostridia bacterium]
MRRFKRVICVILCLLLCLSLPSCKEKEELPTTAEIADSLKELSSTDITWVEISSNKLSSYFGFGADTVEEFKGYINDSEDAYDIIAVFRSENRQEVIKGINLLVSEQESTYRVASENVFAKISGKLIAEKQDVIVLCIMDNYEKAKKYFTDTLKAEIIS